MNCIGFADRPRISLAFANQNKGQGKLMKLLLGVALSLAMLGTAYAEPTIDASSQKKLERSLEDVRASLSESEIERFDGALAAYIYRAMLGERDILEFSEFDDSQMDELYSAARLSLHDLTAEELFAQIYEDDHRNLN